MKKIFYSVLTLFLLSVASYVGAVPAKPGIIRVKQPDGSLLSILLQGDEHSHYTMTADSVLIVEGQDGYYRYADGIVDGVLKAGSRIARDKVVRSAADQAYVGRLQLKGLSEEQASRKLARRIIRPQKLMGNPNVPSTGDFKGLIILANYQDQKFAEANTPEFFSRMVNEKGFSDDGATGSVRDYYLAQSGGKFSPTFDVVGPVTLSHDYAYYGSDTPSTDANAGLMIKEACLLADSLGVDFSKYDNDGDGQVDMVYVIYAGYSESNGASANTIWPHMYYLKLTGNDVVLDSVTVNCYATGGERQGTSGEEPMGIGLICHEFTHTLGMPDIYDTSTSYPKNIDLGSWDVMSRGCYNNNSRTPAGYCSYEQTALGWVVPTEFTDTVTGYHLKSLGGYQQAVKLANPNNPNECFLLENRTKSNIWDAYLPGEGMLVVHVNYDSLLFDNNMVNTSDGYHVHIVSANGSNLSGTDGASIAFPGADNNHAFTALTTPATVFDDGTEINLPITNIRYDGNVVTFDINQKPAVPMLTAETNVTPTGFRANWSRMSDASYYELRLTKLADNSVTDYKKILRNRFTLSSLDSTATYSYQVRSQGDLAYSDWSEPRVINLATPTGIDRIATSQPGKEEYFDLQGRRVNSPAHGIYIIRKNGRAVKVTR